MILGLNHEPNPVDYILALSPSEIVISLVKVNKALKPCLVTFFSVKRNPYDKTTHVAYGIHIVVNSLSNKTSVCVRFPTVCDNAQN